MPQVLLPCADASHGHLANVYLMQHAAQVYSSAPAHYTACFWTQSASGCCDLCGVKREAWHAPLRPANPAQWLAQRCMPRLTCDTTDALLIAMACGTQCVALQPGVAGLMPVRNFVMQHTRRCQLAMQYCTRGHLLNQKRGATAFREDYLKSTRCEWPDDVWSESQQVPDWSTFSFCTSALMMQSICQSKRCPHVAA